MSDKKEKVIGFVKRQFDKNETERFQYHNLKHTLLVVEKCCYLAQLEDLSEREHELLELAAWLHDFGYLFSYSRHEERSAKMARKILTHFGYGKEDIETVQATILSTQINAKPNNEMQKIIKDADFYHFSCGTFYELSMKLWWEITLLTGKQIDTYDWCEQTLDLMLKHQYYTQYGAAVLEVGKQQNIFSLTGIMADNLFEPQMPGMLKQA